MNTRVEQSGSRRSFMVRHRLPRDVAPGETIEQQLSFLAPNQAGEYMFRVDMIDEYVRWFSEDSESRTLIQVTVE